MKSRSSKRGLLRSLLLALCTLGAASAQALDFKSIDAPVAILYDSPSAKGKRIFLLKRLTPVEVIVSVEGFTKVREPDGAIGWVEKKTLTDKRQVLVTATRAQVRIQPNPDSAVVFEAAKGVALELIEPGKDGWAKVKHIDGPAGMVKITQVWGL